MRKLRDILIVEDNPANYRMLQDFLASRGYNSEVVTTGDSALKWAAEHVAKVVLMDIRLPGMDGLEVIRRMRTLNRYSTVPIVALTSLAMPGDEKKCLEAGFTAYLAKPLNLKKLAKLVAGFLAEQAHD